MLDASVSLEPQRSASESYWSKWATFVIGAVVASPLVVAAIVLAFRPWFPVLDMAMTEFRVRDVGGPDTPLIGLPGRIGNFPDQGSHPGPLSFYLLAPLYRLTGSSAWGLEVGSVVVNTAAIGSILAIVHRVVSRIGHVTDPGRAVVVIGFAAVGALAVRGYGLTVLTHPWNPYLPVMLWLVVLVATWAVLAGDSSMAVVVVVAGTIAAQTHVPYLLLCATMAFLSLGVVAWRAAHRGPDDPMHERRAVAWAVGVGTLLWLPPIIDQLARDPGNIRMLLRHFLGEPPEPAISLATAIDVFFRHLDAPSALWNMVNDPAAFVTMSGANPSDTLSGISVGGVVTLLVWVASGVVAVRRGSRNLVGLHIVVAVALLVGFVSTARIFGKVWYYLTLWAWGTTLLLTLAVVWTLVIVVAERRHSLRGADDHRPVLVAGAVAMAVVVVATALSLGATVTHEVPEPQLSEGLGLVIDPTIDAVERGLGAADGRDGNYVVFWQDAVFIGAQGYGLVNELERRGLDVGVHPTWRVPVTPQRVLADPTAEIHLVSGGYIDEWRRRPGYEEVITVDARSADQRREFDDLRARVIERFEQIGRGDLVAEIDVNLFGASLDPDLPDDVRSDLSEMLVLGEPVAIFIAPSGSTN